MSRPPTLRVHGDLVVDSFAGGGGASLGIEWALGRSPDIAVNHDPEAIAMHAANHPETHHLCGDVWDVRPREVCGGRPVALAWFSPDCKHFSKAKGGRPLSPKVRGLAWVVIRWAKEVRPRVICLENVEEFQTWGPLLDDGKPCPERRGLTFRRWLGQLKAQGYEVEMRELRACDYGAPTSRKRLFVIARCDGLPIVWPEPTHGPRTSTQWRTAAECVEWSIACPSIFDRARPLAENTLRRIARGMQRFVIDSGDPFIVPLTHDGDHRVHAIGEPFRTITAANRGELGLVAPTLIQTGYGERPGQAPRSLDLHAPLGTVVAGGAKHALVTAFLAKYFGGHEGPGAPLTAPFSTVTCRDHHALVEVRVAKERRAQMQAFLAEYLGGHGGLVRVGADMYSIADIGMRMLEARELFRAQGFPDSYEIAPTFEGKTLSKTAQIRMCGNSVSPVVARAIVAANVRIGEVVAA